MYLELKKYFKLFIAQLLGCITFASKNFLLHHPHRLVDRGKDIRRVLDLLPEGELVGGGDGVKVEVGHGGKCRSSESPTCCRRRVV